MSLSRMVPFGAALGAAMLAAGAFGYVFLAPASSGAQTTTTGPAAAGTTAATGAAHSNEDPTHEKGESAQREADEVSGKAFAGGAPDGSFTPNTDPAHEKTEAAARATQENAGQAPAMP